MVEEAPASAEDFAGLLLFKDDTTNVRFGKTLDEQGNPCLKLVACSQGQTVNEAVVPLQQSDAGKKVYLKVSGNQPQVTGEGSVSYTFSYSFAPKKGWVEAGTSVSADLLSTKTAGGFTGTMVGIYATGDYSLN